MLVGMDKITIKRDKNGGDYVAIFVNDKVAGVCSAFDWSFALANAKVIEPIAEVIQTPAGPRPRSKGGLTPMDPGDGNDAA